MFLSPPTKIFFSFPQPLTFYFHQTHSFAPTLLCDLYGVYAEAKTQRQISLKLQMWQYWKNLITPLSTGANYTLILSHKRYFAPLLFTFYNFSCLNQKDSLKCSSSFTYHFAFTSNELVIKPELELWYCVSTPCHFFFTEALKRFTLGFIQHYIKYTFPSLVPIQPSIELLTFWVR